jgi:hypothetical protein
MCDEIRAVCRILRRIVFVERPTILFQALAYLTLLFLREERARTRTPDKLLKAVDYPFFDFLPPEIPYRVTVLMLEST